MRVRIHALSHNDLSLQVNDSSLKRSSHSLSPIGHPKFSKNIIDVTLEEGSLEEERPRQIEVVLTDTCADTLTF
jgi:hypothetical protein